MEKYKSSGRSGKVKPRMKINDDHMYHGAALTQIAEHPQFTAINAFKVAGVTSRSAFKINNDIGVYLKYATKPKPPFSEYVFNFNSGHLAELVALRKWGPSVFLGLVCVKARQICCLKYADFETLVEARKKARGSSETQYILLATAPARKSFRVYVNAPGKRKVKLAKEVIVSRNVFPGAIF